MLKYNADDYNALLSDISALKTATTPNLAHITDVAERTEFSTAIDKMITKLEEIKSFDDLGAQFIKILKEERIPYFILFNTFEDVFPNEIPFAELESNEWIKDLSMISDLDISTITDKDARKKHKHKTDINITLNNDYKKFWTQDISNLSVDWDSDNLYFWVQEDGYSYEPSLRSKGRQWHLGFYIKVSARAKEDVPNIILIDEPGLFLHAKAQKDILSKLEDAGKDAQILFSTHSPYLLETEHLDRIRLIYRNKKDGTMIENKVHALADKETLTPILTAIGLELSSGISNVDKQNNVIVEGASDLFYLQAFTIITNKNDFNFVFGGGAGNMPIVGTVLNGWGCKTVYLFDNDQGLKDGERNLKNNWLVNSDLILSVLDTKGSIEDIFTGVDFCKFILNDESKTISQTNSTYVKKQRLDKVLLAKGFLELVQNDPNVALSAKTKQNITELFKKIEETF